MKKTNNCLYLRGSGKAVFMILRIVFQKIIQISLRLYKRKWFWTANNLRASFAPYYTYAAPLARASFAPCHTYSFLPFASHAKTCWEQVSPWRTKMNFVLFPTALVGDFAPQSLDPLCVFRRGSCLRQSRFLICQSKRKCLISPKVKATGSAETDPYRSAPFGKNSALIHSAFCSFSFVLVPAMW